MNPTSNTERTVRLVAVGLAVITLVCIYSLVRAVINYVGSGTLSVTTPNDDSLISISRDNATADVVGKGTASVHVAPGRYLVGVGRNGDFSQKVVDVSKGNTTSLDLSATSTPRLPSSAAIDFQGTDMLLVRGMTSDQVSSLRKAIFNFKHTAKRAIINPNSVTSPPFDPNSATIGFSRLFTLIIDGTSYRAVASWTNLDSATLQLSDSAGTVVFDSDNGHD